MASPNPLPKPGQGLTQGRIYPRFKPRHWGTKVLSLMPMARQGQMVSGMEDGAISEFFAPLNSTGTSHLFAAGHGPSPS